MLRERLSLLVFLLLVVTASSARASVDKEKLRTYVRLPGSTFNVNFFYSRDKGYTFQVGDNADEETVASVRSALRGDSSDAQRYDKLGYLYAAQGDKTAADAAWEKSIVLYREQVKSRPNDGELQATLAQVLHQAQHKAERDKAIAEAVAHAPTDWKVWIARACLDMADALEPLSGHMETIASGTDPRRLAAIIQEKTPAEAQIHTALNLLDRARDDYDRAVAVAPQDGLPHCERVPLRAVYRFDTAVLNSALKDKTVSLDVLQQAQADFQKAMMGPDAAADYMESARIDRQNPIALGLAAFMVMSGDLVLSGKNQAFDLKQGNALKLLSADAQKNIQELLDRLGELSRSSDHSQAGRGTLVLGTMQMFLLSPTEAETTLRRAYSLIPEDPRAGEALIGIYATQQRWSDLSAFLTEALKRQDTVRRRLLLAKAQAKQQHWDQAEQQVRAALKEDSGSFDANLAFAAVLLQRAKEDAEIRDAGEQLTHAASLYPKSPSPEQYFGYYYLRGIYYGLIGNTAEARKSLENLQGSEEENADLQAIRDLLPAE